MERTYIKEFDTLKNGYNMTEGGESMLKPGYKDNFPRIKKCYYRKVKPKKQLVRYRKNGKRYIPRIIDGEVIF